MQKAIFLLAALLLAGCAVRQNTGNFLGDSTTEQRLDQQKLAGDAARKLAAFWPPATTRFKLKSSADIFGQTLAANLREHGYAVAETGAESKAVASFKDPVAVALIQGFRKSGYDVVPETSQHAVGSETELPLSYTLDAIGNGLYRISLNVGKQTLSRAISPAGPLGAWVRQE